MDWVDLAQNRDRWRVGSCECGNEPSSSTGGCAAKSLARPTSRCRRTESIVSLGRGFVRVPNCKSFLVTEAERKHVR